MVDPVAVVCTELGVAEATVVDQYTEDSGLKDGVYRVRAPDRDVVVSVGSYNIFTQSYTEPFPMLAAGDAGFDGVPAVYGYDIERRYLVMEHVPGEKLLGQSTGPAATLRTVGRLLGRLQRATRGETYGFFRPDGGRDRESSWPAVLRRLVAHYLDEAGEPPSASLADRVAGALATREPASAVYHGDAAPRNVVCPPDGPPQFVDFQNGAVFDRNLEPTTRAVREAHKRADGPEHWRRLVTEFWNGYETVTDRRPDNRRAGLAVAVLQHYSTGAEPETTVERLPTADDPVATVGRYLQRVRS
jgi:tRNA A-37 threonylcarbamoyl transferase component Bud32